MIYLWDKFWCCSEMDSGAESSQIIILNRGDYTSLTINLFGGRVTSWRINNREQLFVSRIAAFSHLTRLWGGIGLSFPHFGKWTFGPDYGFAKNMFWSLKTGPHYLENGDVWATFYLQDDCYTQSIWNYKFKLFFKVTLHEFQISFDISVENYDDNISFEFFFIHHAFFRTPDVKSCEITGLKNALLRIGEHDGYNTDEASVFKEKSRDIVKISEKTDSVFTKVFQDIEINNMIDNGKLIVKSEGADEFHLWNPWKHHTVRYIGTKIS